MARAVVHVIAGLLMASVGALVGGALLLGALLATFVSPAGAQTGPRPDVTLPTTVTTTFPTVPTVLTTPPTSSSVSTTPTTKPRSVTSRPRVTGTTTSTTAVATTTTSTTVAPIPTPPPVPATLPLGTAPQSGNINAFFPILSGIGVLSLAALLTVQWFLTRPGHKGPTL